MKCLITAALAIFDKYLLYFKFPPKASSYSFGKYEREVPWPIGPRMWILSHYIYGGVCDHNHRHHQVARQVPAPVQSRYQRIPTGSST